MSQPSQCYHLPAELWLIVAEFLDARDISSLCRLNRRFQQLLFDLVFDTAIAERSAWSQLEQCLVNLFSHAIKHDSRHIAQYLIYSTYPINLNGCEIFYRSVGG